MRTLPFLILVALAAEAAAETDHLFGNPRGKAGFSVWAVSRRAGLLFTDEEARETREKTRKGIKGAEPVDVRVRVAGAEADTTVEFSVREAEGPWHASGKLAIEKGATEKPLPLELPGRGLYQLDLAARPGPSEVEGSGAAASKATAWIAVVFAPGKPDPASPWGIFYTPYIWFDKDLADGARVAAESHRLLGASWSRLNFWAHSFGKVTVTAGPKPQVTADCSLWKTMAKALRDEGISIMGEISQCPREISSRPDETAEAGDAGPVWCRVKPADYTLWDPLIERLAADFRDEIQVWEIWNEPNLPNRYWTGTVEDFALLIQHTSQALRRGNPKARIAIGGFVDGHAFADRLLQLGIGKQMDILSVHYTDERPESIVYWKRLLDKYQLRLPIWTTEERSEVPLHNLAGGIERSFKFIHVQIGYSDYRPLVRKDWTLLPAGILFSVGAHCIGAGRHIAASTDVPGWEAHLFQRGEEVVGVFKSGTASPKLFSKSLGSVTLSVEPLEAGKPPVVTDVWGRSRPLKVEGGQAVLPLAGPMLFVNGARKLAVAKAAVSEVAEGALVFEAERGRWTKGWGNNPKAGFSEGRILEIWAAAEPDSEGYWAEVKLSVPAAGQYEILFSGNALSRLKSPRSLSPFVWSLDGGADHKADDALPDPSPAPGARHDVASAPEGLSVLGTAALSQGEHVFRLKLTGRRNEPDRNYALWFDAIALRLKSKTD